MGQSLTFQDPSSTEVAKTGMARLADQLVESLGVEDALRTCRENSWYGIQQVIQSRAGRGSST